MLGRRNAWLAPALLLTGLLQTGESRAASGRLYAVLTNQLDALMGCRFPFPRCDAQIEVVDLGSSSRVRTLALGERGVTSITVSPDEQYIYLSDAFNRVIVKLDPLTGAVIDTLPAGIPRDLLLAPGGDTLYVSDGSSLVVIDTAAWVVSDTLSTAPDTLLGLALSSDGARVVAPSTQGLNPALYIFDTAPLALRARIALSNPGEPTNCGQIPNDSAITEGGRVLLWDANCDNLYQVDLASETQLTSETIRLERDAASLFNFNDILHYSSSSGRAYALKESKELAVMDPLAASGVALGGFSGRPFVPLPTADGNELLVSVLHRFAGGGADTLDSFDTLSETWTRSIYTFGDSTKSVRTMALAGEVVLSVRFSSFEARREAAGVRLEWTTAVELDTMGFEVQARDLEGALRTLPGVVMARGAGSRYELLDSSSQARSGRTAAYRILELSFSGGGDRSGWLEVGDTHGTGARSRRQNRGSGRSRD